jgi:16S rRNA (cytosine1402-N4)-methyltransferase
MDSNYHVPVLFKPAIEGLNLKEDSIVLDLTLGRAGHSSIILSTIKKGHLYAIDKDQTALDFSRERLSKIGNNFTLFQGNFSEFTDILRKNEVDGADAILLDIGVSSPQFDNPERGFSYRFDSKLDMRMNCDQKLDAYYVVNNYSEEQLRKMIYEYGEDQSASKIARAIVKAREIKPIETTFELVDVIKSCLPYFILNKPGHPAKQTFQAIRYEVNQEIEELKTGLSKAINFLNVGGRLSIITFNSLEDKIAKNIIKDFTKAPPTNRHMPPVLNAKAIEFTNITRKPIAPSEKEIIDNPRSKSAKLRIIERTIK